MCPTASPGCATPQGPGHLTHIEHGRGGGHWQPGLYEVHLSRELKSCPTDVKEERLELRNNAFQLEQNYTMDLSTNFASITNFEEAGGLIKCSPDKFCVG